MNADYLFMASMALVVIVFLWAVFAQVQCMVEEIPRHEKAKQVIFAKAGPVYVDGKHICTLTMDVARGTSIQPGQFILPDGSTPRLSEKMPTLVAKFVAGKISFTQPD